jgi:SAM-dependent methyltransferase
MSYETRHRIPVQKLNLVAKHLGDHTFKSCKVLDIGGISGYRSLLEQVFPSASVYILNTDNNVKSTPAVRASALELPFIDAWDVVTAFDILEHLTVPDAFLSECHRILKHDGIFVISSPNLATLYNRIVVLLGFMPYHYDPSRYNVGRITRRCIDGGPRSQLNMGHMSVFTYGGLKALLDVHGFQTVHSDGFSYTDSFYVERNPTKKREAKTYKWRRALNTILPRSAREGVLIIARKRPKGSRSGTRCLPTTDL